MPLHSIGVFALELEDAGVWERVGRRSGGGCRRVCSHADTSPRRRDTCDPVFLLLSGTQTHN